jgi:hypothetical protein
MTPTKTNAPELGGTAGHQDSGQALAFVAGILTTPASHRHMPRPWATKTQLALAMGCCEDTAHARALKAGVERRVTVTPENRARIEYRTNDVVRLLIEREGGR